MLIASNVRLVRRQTNMIITVFIFLVTMRTQTCSCFSTLPLSTNSLLNTVLTSLKSESYSISLQEDGEDISASDKGRNSTITANASVMNHIKSSKMTWDHISLMNHEQIAYFYLSNTLGLSEEAMWKITLGFPSVLGFRVKTLQEKVEFLRSSIDLDDDELRSLIELQPPLLYKSLKNNLIPTVTLLKENLGLSKDDMKRIFCTCPAILCYSIDENLIYKLAFFLITLGFDQDEARKLFLQEPRLLACSVDSCLAPKFHFFCMELLLDPSDMKYIISKNPSILLMSLDKNIRRKIVYLFMNMLSMDTAQVGKVLRAFPNILDYSLDDHIVPILRYFRTELDYSKDELRRTVIKYPRIFTLSLRKIKYMIGYLKFELNFDPEGVQQILYYSPKVLGLDPVNNLKAKLDFLRDKLDLSDDELKKIITGMPTLFQLNIKSNLQPKVEYLLEAFSNDKDKLRHTVHTLPSLLGYSLENRIKPRMQQILGMQEDPSRIKTAVTLDVKKFEEWINTRKVSREYESRIEKEERLKEIEDELVRRKAKVVRWTR